MRSTPYDTATLEKSLQLAVGYTFDPKVEISHDVLIDRLACACHWSAWCEAEGIGTYTFMKPKTWWQAFKHECFPQWLQQRFPVKWLSETVAAKLCYPEYTPKFPGERVVFPVWAPEESA